MDESKAIVDYSKAESEDLKIDKERAEKDKKSRKKAKSDAKNSTKGKTEDSGLGGLISRLIGIKSGELEHKINKETNEYDSNKKKATKKKAFTDKQKQKHSGHPGIDNTKKKKDRIIARLTNRVNKVGTFFGTVLSLAPMVVGFFEKAIELVKERWDDIKDWMLDKWENLKSNIVGGWDKTREWFSNIGQTFTEMFDSVSSSLQGAISTIGTWFSNLFIDIHNWIANLWNVIANSKIGKALGFSTMSIKEHKVASVDSNEEVTNEPSSSTTQSHDAASAASIMAETGNALAGKVSNNGKYDSDKPEADSEGKCARHTVDSINAGLPAGNKIKMPEKASDLYGGNELEKVGFREIDIAEARTNPKVGDVVVENAIPEHPYGHIQLYTGDMTPIKKLSTGEVAPRPWVSDFRQKSTTVHDIEGSKKAWRYIGSNNVSLASTDDQNQGLGGDGNSGSNIATTRTNNVVNSFSNNNSRTIFTGSNGAEDQRD